MRQKLTNIRYLVECQTCRKQSGEFKNKQNIGSLENVKKTKIFSTCKEHNLKIIKVNLEDCKMIEWAKNQTPEELNFNFSLAELKEISKELKIKGRSKMDKITLCLNIEYTLGGK